ncbi:unnamed protein product, partial [Mesorhabditis spiculigera]
MVPARPSRRPKREDYSWGIDGCCKGWSGHHPGRDGEEPGYSGYLLLIVVITSVMFVPAVIFSIIAGIVGYIMGKKG